MQWSFRYVGPPKSRDVRACGTCAAAVEKRCGVHNAGLHPGCPTCDASRDGFCRSHCGIATAIDRHDLVATDPDNFKWKMDTDQAGVRDGGRRQVLVQTPMTAVKQERIDKARAQFEAVKLAILAQAELFEGFGVIEVNTRGDDLEGKTTLELSVVGVE